MVTESDAPQDYAEECGRVRPGPGIARRISQPQSPTIVLSVGITWPGLVPLEVDEPVRHSLSSHSVRSPPEPPHERTW